MRKVLSSKSLKKNNQKYIRIKGSREHNLKNIDVDIPKEKITVITGLSGSGKSSLAFDTLYAEGQRRYVESLSAYARQFLEMMQKPDVDMIEGLSPAISSQEYWRLLRLGWNGRKLPDFHGNLVRVAWPERVHRRKV